MNKKLPTFAIALWLLLLPLACTPALGSDPNAPKTATDPQGDAPTQTQVQTGDDEPTTTQTPEDSASNNTGNDDSDDTTPADENPPADPVDEEPAPAACAIDFNTFPTGTSFFSAFGDDGCEPSGAVWNATTQTLFAISDDGVVSSYDPATGVVETSPTIPYNLEGLTIADESSSLLYLGVEDQTITGLEHRPLILEYDWSTKTVQRTFDLQSVMDPGGSYTATNLGLEALAFVPNATSAEGGYFYAGLQATGEVFVIELPLVTDTLSTSVTPQPTLPAVRAYIADLAYVASEDALYAVYDFSETNQKLSQISTTDGSAVQEWDLPLIDIEALALDTAACRVFLGQDLSSYATGIEGELLLYDFLP